MIKNNISFNAQRALILQSWQLMTSQERISSIWLITIIVISGFLESLLIAMVLPLVYVIIDPKSWKNSKIGASLNFFLGWSAEEVFPYIAVVFIGLLLVSAVFSGLIVYWSERHSEQCRNRMSREVVAKLLDSPYIWLCKQNTSSLRRRIQEDIRAWRGDFLDSLFVILQSVVMIISPVSVVIILAPVRGMISILIVSLLSISSVLLFRRAMQNYKQQEISQTEAMLKALDTCIVGARDIIVNGSKAFFIDRFNIENIATNELRVLGRVYQRAPVIAINALGQVGFIIIALILRQSNFSGVEIAGQLALFGVVVSRVIPAFNRLAGQFGRLTKAAPMTANLLSLLKAISMAEEKERVDQRIKSVPQNWKQLEFSNVFFSYKSNVSPILEGINFLFERGKTYGFVGRSGAGKTTLINLIIGLYSPVVGEIRLDGTSLNEINLNSWWVRCGYVPQNPFVVDGSIKENIMFGDVAFDGEWFSEVIERVALKDFVAKLPDGINGRIGENGRSLSGGQLQRLAIARALYRRPEILFLDEATSALDAITENEIGATLASMPGDVLKLIVTHRISTLKSCDAIIMLDEGKITAWGGYEDLLKSSENFRHLANQDS